MTVPKSVAALAVTAMMLLTAVGFMHLRHQLGQPMRVPEGGRVLEVPSGISLRALSEQLARDGILDAPLTLIVYGRITGLASRIKAGEYDLAAGTTPRSLLQQLVEGRVRLHALTVLEGWTTRDLMQAVRNHPAIRQTLPDTGPTTLIKAFNLPASSPEGWFFPDTYHFARNTSDYEILAQSHERMRVMLDRVWAQRQENLPLRSPYEALILASIIEKETGLDLERSRVSGVFVRRLQAGMRLQTDPTVIYGLGAGFDGNLTRRDLESDTPYNTYTRAGLPPSPISLPGEKSLLAAVRPDSSPALFFVASGNGDGSHVFSENLEDHNIALHRYLRTIRNHQQ